MKYEFFSDPGHGWLKVPLKEIEQLGLADKISICSYINAGYVYLEEDWDLPLFLQAKWGDCPIKEAFYRYIVVHHSNNISRIRTYASYNSEIL